MIHALLVPNSHTLINLKAVARPELLQADLRVNQHEPVPVGVCIEVHAKVGVQVFRQGRAGRLGDDVWVVVGHGQGRVDEQFGDADFAEFGQDGEAAEGEEGFAAVVDGGFGFGAGVGRAVHVAVLVEGVVDCVGWWDEADGADGEFGAGAWLSHGMSAFGCWFNLAWHRSVCGPGEAPSIIEVELVL